MIIPTPLRLVSMGQPFDDPDWLYEIKHDGFRALAVIDEGRCRFFSKRKHRLTGFRDLGEAIVEDLHVDSAILDGELAATDEQGRTVFSALMARTQPVFYFAFDLLWLNGRDLRALPLVSRKQNLEAIFPPRSSRMLYVDYARGAGTDLYRLVCRLDLEGIVAKRMDSSYDEYATSAPWIKIVNPGYSQKDGRSQLLRKAGKT